MKRTTFGSNVKGENFNLHLALIAETKNEKTKKEIENFLSIHIQSMTYSLLGLLDGHTLESLPDIFGENVGLAQRLGEERDE